MREVCLVGDGGRKTLRVEQELMARGIPYKKVERTVNPRIGPELRLGDDTLCGVANIVFSMREILEYANDG